ncbi:MAG: peptide ABC transporter substrate-binding protein [Candidatus Eremiobacteraeota bacterium]|nr:peptide ABC transporter substrate-binding protein [Candidatus Eremiobacteraeota bacterium]
MKVNPARALWAIAAGAALLCGCTRVGTQTSGGPQTANRWTVHGVLRWAGNAEPDNMNPIVGNQQVEVDLSMFWAGYLFNWKDTNEFEPELATQVPTLQNGGIAKDGLAITYHLRKGVKWQDGAPFNADDVIYTFQQIMNRNNNVASRVGYELVERIDKKDDYTITVHLSRRYAPFIATFFTMAGTPYPVLPKHLLAKYPDINRVAYNNLPVGTGPFKVVQYTKGSLIKMVANPNYWRGAPKLKEIDYHVVPDENTILTQLRTHEIDFEYYAPASQAPSLRKIPGTRIYLTPFTQYGQLALNLDNPILKDVRVRQALAYATDQQALIANVSHGVYTTGDSDQPPFLWAHNPDVKKYAPDMQAAGRLLDQAGWKMGSGNYRYKDGQKLSLVIAGSTGRVEAQQMEEIVQNEWRKIGIDTQVKNYVAPLFFATYGAGGIIQTGKFDVAFFSWINGVDPDDSTNFMCNQFPPAGQNVYHFCSPALDAAENTALTNYDQTQRKQAYDKIQGILAEQEPLILVWYVQRQDIANTDLKNYRPAHAVTTFWNTWEWEI